MSGREPARRRQRPVDLGGILFDVARRAGGDRWREALAHGATVRALGPQLARRLDSVRLDGAGVVLLVRGAAAAREVERHADTVARRLRAALRDGALRVRVEALPDVPRAPAPPAPAPVGVEDRPLTRDALADVVDERLRERLARWAGLPRRPAGGSD